jgi:hypothetical protein
MSETNEIRCIVYSLIGVGDWRSGFWVSGIPHSEFCIPHLKKVLLWTDPAPGSWIQEKMFREKTRQSRKEMAKGRDRS